MVADDCFNDAAKIHGKNPWLIFWLEQEKKYFMRIIQLFRRLMQQWDVRYHLKILKHMCMAVVQLVLTK
jgi:hypothetical protein